MSVTCGFGRFHQASHSIIQVGRGMVGHLQCTVLLLDVLPLKHLPLLFGDEFSDLGAQAGDGRQPWLRDAAVNAPSPCKLPAILAVNVISLHTESLWERGAEIQCYLSQHPCHVFHILQEQHVRHQVL